MKGRHSKHWLDILGNPHRRNILKLIATKPHYQGQIAKKIGITPMAVNKHLTILENMGIISRKNAKRTKGSGRDLKYCRLAKDFSFSFDTSNPEFFKVHESESIKEDEYLDIKIEDEIEIKDRLDNFSISESNLKTLKNVVKEIQFNLSEIKNLESKRKTINSNLRGKYHSFSKFMIKLTVPAEVFVLYRSLLLKFGIDESWTIEDVINILNTNYNSANELIRFMEDNLKLIEFLQIESNPKQLSWKLVNLNEN